MNRTPYLLATITLCLSGCHIDTHKNGASDNVNISTPFGGMHVDTHADSDTAAIGLSAYPGATPLKDDDGKDSKSANVDMSFGDFHLGVKATSFRTSDASDKVLAFYRKDLSKYGSVITCQNDAPVGTPTQTSQGLTCSDSDDSNKKTLHLHGSLNGNHIAEGNGLELRAGSKQHQHIVGVEKKDGYTKIGLVLLDLPSHLDNHTGKEVE
jgi:hypothetical protein